MPGPPVPMRLHARMGRTAQASSSVSLQAARAPGLGSGPEERSPNSWPCQTLEGGWMDGVGGWGDLSELERERQGRGPWAELSAKGRDHTARE